MVIGLPPRQSPAPIHRPLVNNETGEIPELVDPPSVDDLFSRLCYAAAAPPHAVTRFLHTVHRGVQTSIKNKDQRRERLEFRERNTWEKQPEARALLAQKLQETRERLDGLWNQALAEVYPEPLTEEQLALPPITRLKKSFVNAGGVIDMERFKNAVNKALSPTPPKTAMRIKPPTARANQKSKVRVAPEPFAPVHGPGGGVPYADGRGACAEAGTESP